MVSFIKNWRETKYSPNLYGFLPLIIFNYSPLTGLKIMNRIYDLFLNKLTIGTLQKRKPLTKCLPAAFSYQVSGWKKLGQALIIFRKGYVKLLYKLSPLCLML